MDGLGPRERSAVVATRRIDLDWLRIAAFGVLIFYHVGMLYVSWDYHVKSPHRIVALEPLMLAVNPWRMGLLFLISGAATRFMTASRGSLKLAAARSWRLLPPLLFGMAVIVAPQAYDQVVERTGYAGGFLAFYRDHYFAFGTRFCRPGPCLILPAWNHLWYVGYLWVYTMLLCVVLRAWPDVSRWLERALTPALSGIGVLLLPAAALVLFSFTLRPYFPQTYVLTGDWYCHALYGTLFVFGFLFARADRVWQTIERQRWLATGVAAALFLSFLALRALRAPDAPVPLTLLLYGRSAYGVYQWACILAVLGFARRWLNGNSPVRRYLTDAIFPYYIVHQTAIIALAHALRGAHLPAWQEAGLIVTGTALCCAATYEIVRRIPPLRPLFGLRLHPRLN